MDLIILPAHDEAATVGAVVRAIRQTVAADVLVIDDGSRDDTARVAAQAGARVCSSGRQTGYGATMQRGFSYAVRRGYQRVASVDADGQHDPAHLPQFLALASEWDVVSGTRYHPDSPSQGVAPPDRVRINRELTARINALTGWRLTDVFCGYKAYRVDALSRLGLTETGYAFPMQFWMQAARAGLRITELPVGKIYLDVPRSFGLGLGDPCKRRAYYLQVLEDELGRSLLSAGAQ